VKGNTVQIVKSRQRESRGQRLVRRMLPDFYIGALAAFTGFRLSDSPCAAVSHLYPDGAHDPLTLRVEPQRGRGEVVDGRGRRATPARPRRTATPASAAKNIAPNAANQTATRTIIAQKSTATREARCRLKMTPANTSSAAATISHGRA